MILYNVTINVDDDIREEWLRWMKEEHIPEIMATGFFLDSRILRLLSEQPDASGVTYAVQYQTRNMGDLDTYLKEHAPLLQQKHIERYAAKAIAFRSVLEEV